MIDRPVLLVTVSLAVLVVLGACATTEATVASASTSDGPAAEDHSAEPVPELSILQTPPRAADPRVSLPLPAPQDPPAELILPPWRKVIAPAISTPIPEPAPPLRIVRPPAAALSEEALPEDTPLDPTIVEDALPHDLRRDAPPHADESRTESPRVDTPRPEARLAEPRSEETAPEAAVPAPQASGEFDEPERSTPPAEVIEPERDSRETVSRDEPSRVSTLSVEPGSIPAFAREERATRPGERFSITLVGPGWLFLGSSGPIDFIGRERRGNDTVFTFRKHGDNQDTEPIELSFEMQDLGTGERFRHETVVVVREEGSPATAQTHTGREETPPEVAPAPAPGAGGVASSDSRDDSSELPLVERLRDAGRQEGPISGAERTLLEELRETRPDQPAETLAFVDRLIRNEERTEAIALLETLLETGVSGYDRVLYRLASLYEEPGDKRDLARSRDLYRRLVEEYPLSEYWERATARVEFLERHFFFIR